MKVIIFTLFGICLAVLVLRLGTVEVSSNLGALLTDHRDYTQEANQDLFKLKGYWETSDDRAHKDALIKQMCEIRSKMSGASAEIETFLHSRCN